jgi:hypothetical protein
MTLFLEQSGCHEATAFPLQGCSQEALPLAGHLRSGWWPSSGPTYASAECHPGEKRFCLLLEETSSSMTISDALFSLSRHAE